MKDNMEDYDYHSRSWLSLTELLAHDWSEMEPWSSWPAALSKISQLATGTGRTTDDVRLVFAFDN